MQKGNGSSYDRQIFANKQMEGRIRLGNPFSSGPILHSSLPVYMSVLCLATPLWRLLGLQMLRGDKCPTHRKKQGGKRSYHVWRIFSSEQVTVQPVLRDSLPPVETTGHLSDSRKVPRDCEAPVARGGADAAEEGQVDNGEVPRGAGAIVVRRTGLLSLVR